MTAVVLADEVLELSVSAATPCNRFPKGESQDVRREARLCWPVSAVEWTWTRWVEPSDGSRSTEMILVDPVEWSGFVGVDEHSLVLVEEVDGCTSRWSSTSEAECGSQIVVRTLAAVESAGLDTQKRLSARAQAAEVAPWVDLEPPAVVEHGKHTEQNLGQ